MSSGKRLVDGPMADNSHTSILRRMTDPRADEVAQSPLTTSRAVRMAMIKAAHGALGLVVTVTGVEEMTQSLDEMLSGLPDNLMLVALQRQSQPVGLLCLDMQMRAAIVELQTIGQVSKFPPDARPATSTDKQMSEQLMTALLHDLTESVTGTEFEGWLDGLSHHEMVPHVRAAALMLEDQEYRILRMSIDLGIEGRAGDIILALPLQAEAPAPEEPVPDKIPWDPAFRQVLANAPSVFDVELHRFEIPLMQAENLQVGQVLPLPGCTVSSARLVSLDGRVELSAKLGQIGGKRAVRIEQAPVAGMSDLAALPPDQPQHTEPMIDPGTPDIGSPLEMETGEMGLADVGAGGLDTPDIDLGGFAEGEPEIAMAAFDPDAMNASEIEMDLPEIEMAPVVFDLPD